MLKVYADASVQPGKTGLGLAIKDATGTLIGWRGKPVTCMTNTAAEYAAVIYALEQALSFEPDEITVFSDNQVVIEQLRGGYTVRSKGLLTLHSKALCLAKRFAKVTFVHIPREQNRLADAMADDACQSLSRVRAQAKGG
jgi:ribonuclease HI